MSDAHEPAASARDRSEIPGPNLFVVGAPRCGTTFLHSWLADHPDIFMSRVKEPHFFSADVNAEYERYQGREMPGLYRSLEDYLELFKDGAGAAVRGESSVYYLFSEVAAGAIHDYEPEARIVCMLRDPVSFLHSLHAKLVVMGDETQGFERALELEDERRGGRKIPRSARMPSLLFYSDHARFAQHLERFQRQFTSERMRVLLLDDLRQDRLGTYHALLDFLGVERRDPPERGNVNANTAPRSRHLAGFVARQYRSRPGRLRRRGVRWLERLNTKEEGRRRLDPGLERRLKERFAPEVEALGRLLDRDLMGLWGYDSV